MRSSPPPARLPHKRTVLRPDAGRSAGRGSAVCLAAVAVSRYLRATAGQPGQAAAVREHTDAAA